MKDTDQVAVVKQVRELVGSGDNGLEIKVTGPGAFVADAEGVYQGIDMTLLAATAGIVVLVLLATYRSPVLWLIPLITVAFGDGVASWIVYVLATHHIITLDGQSAGILPVLVFGVGTDYALLLVARYREELHRHADEHVAMEVAMRRAGPVMLASGAIVVCAMLCLFASKLNSNQALAVVGALSIGFTAMATVTLLPPLLLILGRRAFWPFVPKAGEPQRVAPLWSAVGTWVSS